ncbi:MAG: carboxypeptidase-like regulatory domain-containing protein [bacterium]
MVRRREVLLVALLVFTAASSVSAQRVHGVVRDSITGAPVAGAVVLLSDSIGTLLARSIGDETGAFTMLRLRGSASIRIVRIGYHPRDVTLSADDSIVDIRLGAIPAFLDAMTASSERVCPGEHGTTAGFELWQQARAALLASVVSRESHPPRIRLLSFERTRDPVLNRVSKDESHMKELVLDRSYVAARPAWAFAYEGYMREDGRDRTYYAPDDETLLDPSFANTHCLQLARNDRDHADQVGIAFEPVRDNDRDTLVDVRGVLWLDRAKPALRSLQFEYTGLEPAARESGGEVVFRVMPNGVSMIERWVIRAAIIATEVQVSASGLRRPLRAREYRMNSHRVATQEIGGELASAQWPDGSAWHGLLPRISGILADSAGTAIAGARVWMAKTNDTVVTDPNGRFSLPYVLPGLYAVLATDSVLAAGGLSRTAYYWVYVDRGRNAEVRLLFHPRSIVLSQLCPGASYREGTGVVLGQVVGVGGIPVVNARIDVWRRIQANNIELFRQEPGGAAGTDGKFVICGTPLDQKLRIRAHDANDSAEFTIEKWPEEIVVKTLVVRSP